METENEIAIHISSLMWMFLKIIETNWEQELRECVSLLKKWIDWGGGPCWCL